MQEGGDNEEEGEGEEEEEGSDEEGEGEEELDPAELAKKKALVQQWLDSHAGLGAQEGEAGAGGRGRRGRGWCCHCLWGNTNLLCGSP